MRILLTGGSGFIGKNIQNHLEKKHTLIVPTRDQVDLRSPDALETYLKASDDINCIINAASVGVKRNTAIGDVDCLYENLRLFRNVFQFGKHVNRFIQLGSGAEYSKPIFKKNISEDDIGLVLPEDSYGMAKYFVGQVLENQLVGKFVNLRLFGVFGPYEDYHTRFISNAILRSLLSLPIILNQNALFDYVYVKDFVRILQHFVENPASEISYNVTTSQPITLLELANMVHQLTNNKYPIEVKNEHVNQIYTGNNQRLMTFLPEGFEFTPIKEAVRDLIEWYESWLITKDKIQREKLLCSV